MPDPPLRTHAAPAPRPPVVLHVTLVDAAVVRGHVRAEDRPSTVLSFCGWLDLMSVINTLRADGASPLGGADDLLGSP
jgi:hypothetical protein